MTISLVSFPFPFHLSLFPFVWHVISTDLTGSAADTGNAITNMLSRVPFRQLVTPLLGRRRRLSVAAPNTGCPRGAGLRPHHRCRAPGCIRWHCRCAPAHTLAPGQSEDSRGGRNRKRRGVRQGRARRPKSWLVDARVDQPARRVVRTARDRDSLADRVLEFPNSRSLLPQRVFPVTGADV